MINLKFLNSTLGKVSGDEFKVLYLIANTISLKKDYRTKIYREEIADKLGWDNSERPEYGLKKVTRITNQLTEKGFLIKDIVYVNPHKSENYYRLNTQIIGQKDDSSTQKTIPLINNEKEIKIENNNKKEIDENPLDGFSQFPLKEHEELLNSCIERNASTEEAYSLFAQKGQASFDWLCSQLKETESFYNGTAITRGRVARKYQLSIPTFS